MADKECRPSRISRNRSGSTTNPDHNMLWSMRTRRPPSSLCSRSAAIPSAEPAASERRRRRVRRVMGRSCAGPFIRARTRPNRRGAHGFGRFFCSPPRRLRYACCFCPAPPRAPIFGTVRPQSAMCSLLFRAAKVGICGVKREDVNIHFIAFCAKVRATTNWILTISAFYDIMFTSGEGRVRHCCCGGF